MLGRISRHLVTAAGVAMIGAMLAPVDAAAQDGRFRVFVPDLFNAEGTSDGFGKDVAKELREIIDELAIRHVAIERNEIRDGLKDIDVKIEDLDCIGSVQFAPSINAQIVVCINYQEAAGDMMEFTTIEFRSPGGASFSVDTFSIDKDEKEAAAQRIYDAFDRFTQLEQARQYCFDYSQLQQWDDARRNCETTLEMNPEDEGVQFQMAQIFRQAEDNAAALEKVEIVLELNPYHEDALYLGGFLATELGNDDAALGYFSRYLEMNQDAAVVRRRIAFDLADGGDYRGAMQLIEEGMGPGADIGLYEQRGSYAFRLAREMMQGVPVGADGVPAISPEVRELYETAIEDLTRVYEERGDSTNVQYLTNVVNAQMQLGDTDQAIALGQRFTQTFSDAVALWAAYAQALGRADRVDDAIAAWDQVGQINPEYPQLYQRQATLLLQAGRRDDAVPLLQRAVADGFDSNQAARLIFSDAWREATATEPAKYEIGIAGIVQAKEFETNEAVTSELNFFHGYARYKQGEAIVKVQEPGSNASDAAKTAAARQALPVFREAQQLLEAGRRYANESGQNIAALLEGAQTYIEIQEILIGRGGL